MIAYEDGTIQSLSGAQAVQWHAAVTAAAPLWQRRAYNWEERKTTN